MSWPPSDHFDGKTFINPGAPPVPGLGAVIKWKLTSHPVKWPPPVAAPTRTPPPPPQGEGVAVTWVGHSTFLFQAESVSVLTDPVFSDRAGPLSWLGAKRHVPPGIAFDSLPRINLVLLSHDHYDHCDLPTLRRLAQRDQPTVVAPLGHGPLLREAGFKTVVELDWWEDHALPGQAAVTLVPARHWCRRSPFRTNSRLWGGFMVSLGGRRLYFAGDSGYTPGFFPEIGRRCGAPDLAMIPIGAYEPRWFMASAHMNPAEAVQVHREVGARRSIGMHWGTFQLTDEGWDQPVRDLETARGAEAFEVLPFGGSTSVS